VSRRDNHADDATPAAWRYSAADALTPANAYYGPTGADITSSTGTPTVDSLYAFPFYAGFGGIVDQVGFNVTTGGTSGSKARCGIYASEPSGYALAPGALLADGGEYDTTTTGAKITTLSSTLTLKDGAMYWLAFICGTAAPTVTTFTSGWHIFGRNSGFNAQFGWQKTSFGYGALPATFPIAPQPGICSSAATLVVVRFAEYNRVWRID
jgi:hypothetical protein